MFNVARKPVGSNPAVAMSHPARAAAVKRAHDPIGGMPGALTCSRSPDKMLGKTGIRKAGRKHAERRTGGDLACVRVSEEGKLQRV
jgi:hypothetical protein